MVQGWNDGSEDYNKIHDLKQELAELKAKPVGLTGRIGTIRFILDLLVNQGARPETMVTMSQRDIDQTQQELDKTVEEICLGCGRPTADRDCGCPAGTATRRKYPSKFEDTTVGFKTIETEPTLRHLLSLQTCPECDGRGQILDAPNRVLDGRSYWVKCEICNGTGKKIEGK